MSERLKSLAWHRIAVGVLAAGLLFAGGHFSRAEPPVGFYSATIEYAGNVGVFAYGEGRVEATAHFAVDADEDGNPEEELRIVAARGIGALTDRQASAEGSINNQDPSQSNPVSGGQTVEDEQAGNFITFQAYWNGCDDNGCFDEFIELPRGRPGELEFTFDPLLRRAELRGYVDEYRFDIVWSSNNPLGPTGFSNIGHRAGHNVPAERDEYPYSGMHGSAQAGEDVFVEERLGRFASTVEFSSDWIPAPPPGSLRQGDISFVAAARGRTSGEARWGPLLRVDPPPTPQE